MPYSLPLNCDSCQQLLSSGLPALSASYQVAIQEHLTGCAECRLLFQHYSELDALLQQTPDMKPLPNLALRFQQIQQAQHISELDESFAPWEDILKGLSASLLKEGLEEPSAIFRYQKRKTMQKYPLDSDTEHPMPLTQGQFVTPPSRPAARSRRSSWRIIAATVAVLVALVTILSWDLLPHITQSSPTPGLQTGKATPTPAVKATTTPDVQTPGKATPTVKATTTPHAQTLCTATLHNADPQTVGWSSSLNELTLGIFDTLFSPSTCKPLASYTTEANSIWDTTWSPNGKQIALYDGQQVEILDGQSFEVLSSYQPVGTTIVQRAQGVTPLASFSGGIGHIYASAWSPNGAQIASLVVVNAPINSAGSSEIQVWNTSTGKYVRTLQPRIAMNIEAVTWSPDGKYIAAADGNDAVLVWDAHTGNLAYTLKHEVTGQNLNAFSWSPDGHYLAFSDQSTVQVWNMQDGTPAFVLNGGWKDQSQTSALSWSPDGRYIAAASTDVRIFDAQSHQLVYIYTGHHINGGSISFPPGGGTESSTTSYIVALVWSADSTRIASLTTSLPIPQTGSIKGELKVWKFVQ